jgi:hypothetical protein
MAEQETEKPQIIAAKSFMTVGPTLHYSHRNVIMFWFFSIVVFSITCLFWSKVLTGSFWSYSFLNLLSSDSWGLGRYVVDGTSIFEYPWQILVLGLLMGILAVEPVLVSQLMSFRYCLPFIAAIFFLAGLPGFAVFVLISCFAVAVRPLRFRSRFASIALCIAPQLFYWALFGRIKGSEPLVWGFSYTPWICAWIVSLCIAGAVVGIGHFTRYRPGLVFASTCAVLMLSVVVFDMRIGFDELDYQLYVAKNNPDQIEEFRPHSITKTLDKTIANRGVVESLLKAYFYPTEPIALRNELKHQILERLASGDWPWWFNAAPELRFKEKREQLLKDFDRFIETRTESTRMPIALYYKAILSEYSPDIRELEQKEALSFYNDFPFEGVFGTWLRLYEKYPKSPESLEARWRIAKHWAGRGRFTEANNLLSEAQKLLVEKIAEVDKEQKQTDNIFGLFRPPADTAMTEFKLTELQLRISQFRSLIGPENLKGGKSAEGGAARLAKFVMLNPHDRQYVWQLDELFRQTGDKDGLYDNLLLEQTMLIADDQLRMQKLAELHTKYPKTDGGMHALYELGMLKRRLCSEQQAASEQKKKLLAEARDTLSAFLNLYPDSFYAERAKKILADMPESE